MTESNKGIGFFIALQLATSGLFSNVILACRDPERGQRAVDDVTNKLKGVDTASHSCHVSYLPLSLGDSESRENFVKRLEADYGRLDVLVVEGHDKM